MGARNEPGREGKHRHLEFQTAAMWPTARVEDAESSGKRRERGVSDTLTAARIWPTPNSADHKTSADHPHKGGNPTLVMAAGALLGKQAESHSSLPAPTLTDGGTSSDTTATSRPLLRARLNPRFVEWLMGLPRGWTNFAPLETPLSLWSPRMRSCLSGLVCGKDE